MEERNDIVIYKSEDGLVRMEAMVDPVNETIWASQKAIAALFGCTKQNVSYHMGKIFASGELERSAVVKEILKTKYSIIIWMQLYLSVIESTLYVPRNSGYGRRQSSRSICVAAMSSTVMPYLIRNTKI